MAPIKIFAFQMLALPLLDLMLGIAMFLKQKPLILRQNIRTIYYSYILISIFFYYYYLTLDIEFRNLILFVFVSFFMSLGGCLIIISKNFTVELLNRKQLEESLSRVLKKNEIQFTRIINLFVSDSHNFSIKLEESASREFSLSFNSCSTPLINKIINDFNFFLPKVSFKRILYHFLKKYLFFFVFLICSIFLFLFSLRG